VTLPPVPVLVSPPVPVLPPPPLPETELPPVPVALPPEELHEAKEPRASRETKDKKTPVSKEKRTARE
jgi:hypothetical protein